MTVSRFRNIGDSDLPCTNTLSLSKIVEMFVFTSEFEAGSNNQSLGLAVVQIS